MFDILELNEKSLAELRQIASDLNLKKIDTVTKRTLVYKILDQQAMVPNDDTVPVNPKEKSRAQTPRDDDEKSGETRKRRRTKRDAQELPADPAKEEVSQEQPAAAQPEQGEVKKRKRGPKPKPTAQEGNKQEQPKKAPAVRKEKAPVALLEAGKDAQN